jgi:hypothetical protein
VTIRPTPPGDLARRLHVLRRRLRVVAERLADRLPIRELVVEAAAAERLELLADEVDDRLVVEQPVEELALEAAGHRAPVAAHGLEADDLHRLPVAVDDEARVALLAAHHAAAHLGHEEARVDLLELQLEVALAAELAADRRAHLGADDLAQLAAADAGAPGVGLVDVDEERVRVAVDDLVPQLADGLRRDADHVLPRERDRVRDRRREETRDRRPEHPEQRVHQDLHGLRGDGVALALRPRALLPEGARPAWGGCRARRGGTRRPRACGRGPRRGAAPARTSAGRC